MDPAPVVHQVSVVTPVYQGEQTLPALAEEIDQLRAVQTTPAGVQWQIVEWLLVHDNGPDGSADAIGELGSREWVRPVWLSRNYGQHPATLAGMASSRGEWIVTLDEDGQHDPGDIASLLDAAVSQQLQLVYADPVNPPPHSALRNITSKGAKWVFGKFLTGGHQTSFQSFRLMTGDTGRSVAAYVGAGVYLDVALTWVMDRIGKAPVTLRSEGDRVSGYNMRRLIGHFWRLVLTSGTRALRLVSGLGLLLALGGLVYAIYVIVMTIATDAPPTGWASLVVITLLCSGAILVSLGVIAEYIGVLVGMAMGKPPYLIVGDPKDGPWRRRPQSRR